MRASQRRHRIVPVSAERAWAVVGRPELLHLWFPGIVACSVEGSTRTVTTGLGLQFQEDLLTIDRLQRRFQYRIAGGPFREHLASIDVLPLDDATCMVVYASDADPATMAIILGGAMEGALTELARQLESGEGPAVAALDRRGVESGEGPAVAALDRRGVESGEGPAVAALDRPGVAGRSAAPDPEEA